MSFIDKIKKDNIEYDIQDTKGRELIEKCLTEESDPTVPKHVKEITQEKITEWNNKSNFSGQYDDLQGLPDLSKFALESDIPTDYLKEIPSEYITEDELSKALENMPSGSAIPEITENTNIFDLETGIYYVNPGVVLTYANTGFSEEESLNVFVKSILTVEKAYIEDEVGEIYYRLIGIDPTIGTKIVGTYHGYIELIIGFYPLSWHGVKPTFMSMDTIKILSEITELPTGGGGIPEITTDTNIFDLETGVYYVNAGVTLTITNLSTTLDNEEPNIQIYVKSILNVLRCYDPENFSQVYYKLITFNGDTSDGNMVGYYEGYIDGSHGGSQTAWLCKYPVYMEMKNIITLANKVVELTSEATDEQYPSAKAVYDYVNSAIGTALDGEY